jgi:hypothetical protein
MQTTRTGLAPAGSIFTGEGMTTMSDEIDFRMRRLQAEAASERMAPPREGLRQHLGHALMELGRVIHGLEPDQPTKPALRAR